MTSCFLITLIEEYVPLWEFFASRILPKFPIPIVCKILKSLIEAFIGMDVFFDKAFFFSIIKLSQIYYDIIKIHIAKYILDSKGIIYVFLAIKPQSVSCKSFGLIAFTSISNSQSLLVPLIIPLSFMSLKGCK